MSGMSVLIPYKGDGGPRDRIFNWLQARYEALLPEAEVVIGTSEPFSRSAARNDAFRHSTGDVVVVADADTLFCPEQIHEAVEILSVFQTWVLPYGRQAYYNLSQDATERVLELPPTATVPEPRDPLDWEHKLESWAGLLVMKRAAYESVNGYNEHFLDWGYDDNAMRYALDTIWGHFSRLSERFVLHLWHPSSHKTTFGQPHIEENRMIFSRYFQAAGNPNQMKQLTNGHLL